MVIVLLVPWQISGSVEDALAARWRNTARNEGKRPSLRTRGAACSSSNSLPVGLGPFRVCWLSLLQQLHDRHTEGWFTTCGSQRWHEPSLVPSFPSLTSPSRKDRPSHWEASALVSRCLQGVSEQATLVHIYHTHSELIYCLSKQSEHCCSWENWDLKPVPSDSDRQNKQNLQVRRLERETLFCHQLLVSVSVKFFHTFEAVLFFFRFICDHNLKACSWNKMRSDTKNAWYSSWYIIGFQELVANTASYRGSCKYTEWFWRSLFFASLFLPYNEIFKLKD